MPSSVNGSWMQPCVFSQTKSNFFAAAWQLHAAADDGRAGA